uniref:Uncharacterized protein n=1 Tax=Rhizophora mucronata TaxID=61149 RepID=A0A2P2R0E6_RHIMU
MYGSILFNDLKMLTMHYNRVKNIEVLCI